MILFDFDGTLVDVWKRYYKIFSESIIDGSITYEQYKHYKRKLEQDAEVAKVLNVSLQENYFQSKRKLLEDPRYLSLDEMLCEKSQLLEFFQTHKCKILTRRNNTQNFFGELRMLGLEDLIPCSVVLKPGVDTKLEWVKRNLSGDDVHFILGDSTEEMICAELPFIKALFVDTGLRAWENISHGYPCIHIKSVTSFLNSWREGERFYAIP